MTRKFSVLQHPVRDVRLVYWLTSQDHAGPTEGSYIVYPTLDDMWAFWDDHWEKQGTDREKMAAKSSYRIDTFTHQGPIVRTVKYSPHPDGILQEVWEDTPDDSNSVPPLTQRSSKVLKGLTCRPLNLLVVDYSTLKLVRTQHYK